MADKITLEPEELRTLLTGDHEQLLLDSPEVLKPKVFDMTIIDFRGVDDTFDRELARLARLRTKIVEVRTSMTHIARGFEE